MITFFADRNKAIETGWHAVAINLPFNLQTVVQFLQNYESDGRYNNMLGSSIWWFELEEDAIYFKLKCG